MISVHFEYEITADEFASAQILYHDASSGRRKRVRTGIAWIFIGALFIVLAFREPVFNWTPVIISLVGVWWIYAGVRHFFPARYFRRAYHGTGLAGKRYKAEANQEGFCIAADSCSWSVRWPGVGLRGEDTLVFMLYSEGTVFIFGKRYLSGDQQEQFRRLSGISLQPKLEAEGC
jgi:hypothetical protein